MGTATQAATPQHFFSFFPLPQEHCTFRSRPRMFGGRITGEFASITLACRINSLGDLRGNHLLKRKVSAIEAAAPDIGSTKPRPVVVANRKAFAGKDSIQLGFPIDSQ
jgi:hypothetical protein